MRVWLALLAGCSVRPVSEEGEAPPVEEVPAEEVPAVTPVVAPEPAPAASEPPSLPERFVRSELGDPDARGLEAIGGGVGGSLGASGVGVGGGGGIVEGSPIALGGLGTRGSGSGQGIGVGYGFGRGPAPAEALGAERYTDHGVGGVFDPREDPVSTFSIDVDTGSYAIVRRKLREGALPPAAAVRVEELVNALRYGYAPPGDGSPIAVHGELAPHPWLSGHHLLRIGLKARELPTAHRPPIHLVFLVDVSGSMASADKLPLAQRALHYLVDNLGEEDTVALATYAGGDRRVLDPTPTTRADAIHQAIDGLSSGGGTAMESGMTLAYAMAQEAFLAGAENRVVVLSDGDANIGGTSHDQILEAVERYAGQGITLSTVGFGTGNYQDALMEQLADKGDGNYAYIDSMAEAKKVFGADLAGTLRTVARDVKVQVAFDPEAVRSYLLLGYENRDIADKDFRDDAVDAGEIGSGHQVTALYNLVLADPRRPALAEVRLRAEPPGREAPAREWSVALPGSVAPTFGAAGSDTRLAFGVASFAELLRGSPHLPGVGYDAVLEVIRGAVNPEREDHQELIGMVETARKLRRSD